MDRETATGIAGILKDLATILLPLAGVSVGAQLARHSANKQWLQKESLNAYLELLKILRDMVQRFAVGLRVGKFRINAADHGHDYKGVTIAWQDSMHHLENIEVSIRLLGGQLGQVYEQGAHDVMLNMLDAIQDDNISEGEWDDLLTCTEELITALEESTAQDLKVSTPRKNIFSMARRRD